MHTSRAGPALSNQDDHFDNKIFDAHGLFDVHRPHDSSAIDLWTDITMNKSSSYTHTPVSQSRPNATDQDVHVPRVVPSPSPASTKSLADSVKSTSSKKRMREGAPSNNDQHEPQPKAHRPQNIPPHLSLATLLHNPATAPGIMTAPPGQPHPSIMAPWRSRQPPFSVQQGQQYPAMTQDALLSQAMTHSTAFNHMYSQSALQHDLANEWRRSQSLSNSVPSWSEHSSISGPSGSATASSSISGPAQQTMSPRPTKAQQVLRFPPHVQSTVHSFLPQTESQQQQQQQQFFANF